MTKNSGRLSLSAYTRMTTPPGELGEFGRQLVGLVFLTLRSITTFFVLEIDGCRGWHRLVFRVILYSVGHGGNGGKSGLFGRLVGGSVLLRA
jgi:hypothetical protein